MLVYLDTVIAVYFIEGAPPFQQRARDHLAALESAGARFAVSDLVELESLVVPMRNNNAVRIDEFRAFLTGPNVTRLPIQTAAYKRATRIRADLNYKLADALQLSIAVEGNCDRFLTNDLRLGRYTDIPIEVLP